MGDRGYLSYLVTGASYALAGTVALCAVGAVAVRRKLKPKNSWNNQNTLEGITVLITGGNSGLGAAAARDLARRNANVIIACRTLDKSMAVIKQVKAEFPNSPEIKYGHLDLSSLAKTKEFVDELTVDKVDILINNAAVWGSPVPESVDGLEQTFATNYLATFYLTKLMIQKYSLQRVINVSSGLYPQGKIVSDDLGNLVKVPEVLNKDVYRGLYATSKLAQIYHSKELARTCPEIQSFSIHPGLCYTDLARYVKPQSFILSILGRLLPLIIRTPAEGAQTYVYCCVEDGLESGAYYGDCQKESLKDVACNPTIQEKLWEFSEDLIQQKTS